MTLIKCSNCGNEYSDLLSACKFCKSNYITEEETLNTLKDKELKLRIENLIKPKKPSKIWVFFLKTLVILLFLTCIPALLIPIGWFWVLFVILILGKFAFKIGEIANGSKYKKEMLKYNKDVREIELEFLKESNGSDEIKQKIKQKIKMSLSNSNTLYQVVGEVDDLFIDSALIVITHQSASASLIQRKLRIGYNRSGRIIDQLESAGIVGPFEGSIARKVLIKDEIELERALKLIKSTID